MLIVNITSHISFIERGRVDLLVQLRRPFFFNLVPHFVRFVHHLYIEDLVVRSSSDPGAAMRATSSVQSRELQPAMQGGKV